MRAIHTDKAPAAIGPYSQAVAINGILYTSGQIPIDPHSGIIESKGIEDIYTEKLPRQSKTGGAFCCLDHFCSRVAALDQASPSAFLARQRNCQPNISAKATKEYSALVAPSSLIHLPSAEVR